MRVINFPYAGIDRFTDGDVRVCRCWVSLAVGILVFLLGVEDFLGSNWWGAVRFIMGFRMREFEYPVVLYYIHRGICCVVQKFATLWWIPWEKDC